MTTTIPAAVAGRTEHSDRVHRAAIVINGSEVIHQTAEHIADAAEGGVTATNHTVCETDADFTEAVAAMTECRRWISANPDTTLLATTTADIRHAKATGREAVIFGPQNTEFADKDLTRLDAAYELGVRVLQLTYQHQNYVGCGCAEANDTGLSVFGRRLVRHLDELGVVVDLSHCGPKTGLDAIEASANPVVFSHAHPYALAEHVRHKSDDLLRALAERGGVIGITGLTMFLFEKHTRGQRPDLGMFARHMHYLVDLIGIDHVGIGLDFNETNTPENFAREKAAFPEIYGDQTYEGRRAEGLTRAGELPNVTAALLGAGFGDEDVTKILGGNFLRVFEQVWRA